MKKFGIRMILLSLLLFTATVSFSCCTTDVLSSPYLISDARVELGQFEDKHNFAGMHFSLFNESGKNIESFTLSFMLYDSEGNNPFIGSNCIVSKCSWPVKSRENIEFVINLDPYISIVPEEPYRLDYIYVREITYEDGSCWKDPYGMYCTREEVE